MSIKTNILLLTCLLLFSCRKEEQEDLSYNLDLPDHFPETVYDLKKNPVTRHGFELGRKLFYDPRLSVTGTISCGDCHQLFAGFAHADHPVSHGIHDRLGHRNAQHLVNLVYQKDFFWDGGVQQLDLVSIRPLTDTLEMGNTVENVLTTLKGIPEYQQAFKRAFPQSPDAITTNNLLKALSQFMAAIISADSPYDEYITGNQRNFSDAAVKGIEIFKANCNTCHTAPLFTDNSFRSNGLADVTDEGRGSVTLQAQDKYKFKVPSLRNLSLTSPYMHDGRFTTIDEVINFYSSGIQDNEHTDPQVLKNSRSGFQFTQEEKASLKAFLLSLTDQTFLNNRDFDAH